MPKVKNEFWATWNGREGPKIYTSWPECEKNVKGVHGCKHKGFPTRLKAELFLASAPARAATQVLVSSTRDNLAVQGEYLETSVGCAADNERLGHSTISTPAHEVDAAMNLEDGNSTVEAGCKTDEQDPGSQTGPQLSNQQLYIISLIKLGKSVFITGPAGTGKSVLVRAIIELWLPALRKWDLAVTASTGFGLGTKDAHLLVEDTLGNKSATKRWKRVKCLIIDEISMLDREIFEKLDYVGQKVRGNDKPFGGIQLVVSGDFCQLPPVPALGQAKGRFAFHSPAWDRCFEGEKHELTTVFRQKEPRFVGMLHEVRIDQISAETEAEFKSRSFAPDYPDDGIAVTELFPRKVDADRVNQARLDSIDSHQVTFHSHDAAGKDGSGRRITPEQHKEIMKRLAPPKVTFKKGATVMLTMNKVQGKLVNGSKGVIVDFCTMQYAEDHHIAPFNVADEKQLKRVKDSLPAILHNPEFGWKGYDYPLVRFENGRTLLCLPTLFKYENRQGGIMASRVQVPLILAWALSIHKAQGFTIPRLKVDVGRAFERGMVYVALSRATSLDSLQVLNFDKSKVEAHPLVLKFYGMEVDSRELEEEEEDLYDSHFGDINADECMHLP